MIHLLALLTGFAIDLLIGDPPGWPHLVVGMGKLITWFERVLRKIFARTARGEFWGGVLLVILLPGLSFGISILLLNLSGLVHPMLAFALESLLCWQCLATRSLRDESMLVYKALKKDDLAAARIAVGRIVGRDTEALDETGVARAAVETVAENSSDGVIAPMLFMAIGGAPLGVFYKAINTLDSMVGYKNETYANFGKASAKVDDAVNFIPARLAGIMIAVSAFFAGFDARNAWRIFRRDRHNHKSPNSAHTEAACAGALNIQLGGNSYYFGRLVEKPTIGDAGRPIVIEDIRRANRLMLVASGFCLALFLLLKGVILWR